MDELIHKYTIFMPRYHRYRKNDIKEIKVSTTQIIKNDYEEYNWYLMRSDTMIHHKIHIIEYAQSQRGQNICYNFWVFLLFIVKIYQ